MTSPEWLAADEDDADRFPQTSQESGSNVPVPDPARVARYAELIGRLYLQTSGGGVHSIEDIARAVVAVADEESAPLVKLVREMGREAVAEAEAYRAVLARAEAAEAEVERLRRERQHAIDVANRTYTQAVAAEAKVAKVEAERGQLWSRVFSALSRAEQIEPQGSPEWVESGKAMRTTVVREVRLALGKMPMSDEGVARIVDDLHTVLADTPAEQRAEGGEDWKEILSLRWTDDTWYPFTEDEDANITGYGHQDKVAFASALNAYDEDCNGGPIPEADQWTADSIAHQWVVPGDDDRLHPVAEGTDGAIPVTTLWNAR